jgi:hypothetical protein
MSRRRSATPTPTTVSVFSVHPPATAPFISLVITTEELREPLPLAISLGDAHQVGQELVQAVEALLNGAERPWDHDPGRVPFASGGRRGGAAQPAPRREPPGAAATEPRGAVRPIRTARSAA